MSDEEEMVTVPRRMLVLSGKLSTAARNVVGGPHVTIGSVAPASIYTIAAQAEILREALDLYDEAMIEQAMKRHDEQKP